MTQEEQDEAISSACGWKHIHEIDVKMMQAAERALTLDEQRKQSWILLRILRLYTNPPIEKYDADRVLDDCYSVDDLFAIQSATLEQRKESFLRAVGMWVE